MVVTRSQRQSRDRSAITDAGAKGPSHSKQSPPDAKAKGLSRTRAGSGGTSRRSPAKAKGRTDASPSPKPKPKRPSPKPKPKRPLLTGKQIVARYTRAGEPGAYTNPTKLSKALGIDRGKAEKALATSRTAQLHRRTVKKFPRRRILALPGHYLTLDLADMSRVKEHNDGHRFIAYGLDMGSRYGYARPLKTKSAKEVTQAVREMFQEMKEAGRRLPRSVFTDQAGEFKSKEFLKFMKSKHVHVYYSRDTVIKSAMAERFILTITRMLWRYFTENNTYAYLDVLPKIIRSYNTSYHSAIKRAPSSVRPSDAHELWLLQHWDKQRPERAPQFAVGDYVMLVKDRRNYEKSTTRAVTSELFTVAKVIRSTPVTYWVADLNGSLLRGSFYGPELVATTAPELYAVEAVLKKRTRRGKDEYLVKWRDYGDDFNTWVKPEDLREYKTSADLG